MFDLSEEERKVVLFLITMALIGVVIEFLAKRITPVSSLVAVDARIFKIDLNSANRAALMSIAGIGNKTAERILTYRLAHEAFKSIEELKDIEGITSHRFEQIKESLTVR